MKRKMKNTFLILGLAALTLQLPITVVAQSVLNDDFKSHKIDSLKWIGEQNYDPDLREATRTISGRGEVYQLHVAQLAYSTTTDNSGGGGGLFGLNFAVPGAITETAFSVVVNEAKAVACDTNDSLTVTGAQFRGNFFNTKSPPTSQVGNVVAVIDVERHPTDHGKGLAAPDFIRAARTSFVQLQLCSTTAFSEQSFHDIFHDFESSGTSQVISSSFS